MPRRVLKGVVVSNKMQKTLVVKVERSFRHTLYQKIVKRSKKYVVHNEKQEYNVGDEVSIVESRPLSKTKSWIVID